MPRVLWAFSVGNTETKQPQSARQEENDPDPFHKSPPVFHFLWTIPCPHDNGEQKRCQTLERESGVRTKPSQGGVFTGDP
jgi:hypothetical protein